MNKRIRSLLLISTFMVIVFFMGFVMGEGHYKQNIVDALKSNDTRTAMTAWVELHKAGVDVTKNPLYFLTAAKSHAKRGNMEAVMLNLDKMAELLGK